MKATENHAGAEKEQRKTTKHPFRKQRQKDLNPLILSHQHLFGTMRIVKMICRFVP
jgi:hypothetical protein